MIQYAILGLLSWRPLSGYDLKKIIADSDLFYWSGNNNQVYRSLVQLHEAGLVSQEVIPQEALPARKVYTITEAGRAELRRWVLSPPEPPELHNNFLIQLAWADQLRDEELDELLGEYEQELAARLVMQQENLRRGVEQPQRTPREGFLWQRIGENTISYTHNELNWVRGLRRDLRERSWEQ